MVAIVELICLAASVKHSGYCYAGKHARTREWIRPVGNRPGHAIFWNEAFVAPWDPAAVGDILRIEVIEPRPAGCHTENWLMAPARWSRIGRLGFADVRQLLDRRPSLWANGRSTRYGINDEMTEQDADVFDHSLSLIEVDDLRIVTQDEGFDRVRVRSRAQFRYRDARYRLSITDPSLRRRPIGTEAVGRAIICCSLSEPFHREAGSFVYKLAAAIITPDRLQ